MKKLWSLIAALALPLAVQAQYPDRPIRLVVPFAPGGVTDTSGRVVAEALSKRLGQAIVVENKAGASGNIGTQQVAGSRTRRLYAAAGLRRLDRDQSARLRQLPDRRAEGPRSDRQDRRCGAHHRGASVVPGEDAARADRAREEGPEGRLVRNLGRRRHAAHRRRAVEAAHRRQASRTSPTRAAGQAMTDALGGNIPMVFTAVAGAMQHVKAGRLVPIAVPSRQRVQLAARGPDLHRGGPGGLRGHARGSRSWRRRTCRGRSWTSSIAS